MAKEKNKKNQNSVTKPVNLITLFNPNSPISEQYRTIRTNLQFAVSGDEMLRSIVVVSAGPGEGKSTSAANLAVVFAQAGKRVLLVDADMRKPNVHKTFGLSNEVGLSTLISGQAPVQELVATTEIDRLSVLVSGPTPPNPAELLNSRRMNQIIEEMYYYFDLVIFDLPPILTVADSLIMAAKTDGTVLVVREDKTSKEGVIETKRRLQGAKARILGAIYNGASQSAESDYYYYYGK